MSKYEDDIKELKKVYFDVCETFDLKFSVGVVKFMVEKSKKRKFLLFHIFFGIPMFDENLCEYVINYIDKNYENYEKNRNELLSKKNKFYDEFLAFYQKVFLNAKKSIIYDGEKLVLE